MGGLLSIIPGEGTVKSPSKAWASQVTDRHTKRSSLNTEIEDLDLADDSDFLANHIASEYLEKREFTVYQWLR